MTPTVTTREEAQRLSRKAVALIASSLPWLDEAAKSALGAAFAGEYERMLDASLKICLHCGSANVYAVAEGFECPDCRTHEDAALEVVPVESLAAPAPADYGRLGESGFETIYLAHRYLCDRVALAMEGGAR